MGSNRAYQAKTVGLTGGIASGKSTVGRMLRELGAVVIDADEVARAVVTPGTPGYAQVVGAFGPAILQAEVHVGELGPRLDREKLAQRVFSDEAARQTLNDITHPLIIGESLRQMQAALVAGARLVVYEAALLVENGRSGWLDGLIVVDVPTELQRQRAIGRGMTAAQADARIQSQASRADRRAAATWILDNQGDEAALRGQVAQLFQQLTTSPG